MNALVFFASMVVPEGGNPWGMGVVAATGDDVERKATVHLTPEELTSVSDILLTGLQRELDRGALLPPFVLQAVGRYLQAMEASS